MEFRITRHSGHATPNDAMELLLRRLGAQRREVAFAMTGAEIRATWEDDERDSTTRENMLDGRRRAVLEIVREACEHAPELKSDWFAVSPLR
jgi:hypothetical protein